MARNKRVALLFGSVVLLVLTVRIVLAFGRFSRVQHDFASIQKGESLSSVAGRFGKPNYYSGKCGRIDLSPDAGCTVEYVYSDPLAPLNPDYYVVEFSADARVLEAEHLPSP